MMDVMENFPTRSKESEIDAQIDALIAKIMARTASDRDLIDYQELVAARTRLMRPRGVHVRLPTSLRRKYAY